MNLKLIKIETEKSLEVSNDQLKVHVTRTGDFILPYFEVNPYYAVTWLYRYVTTVAVVILKLSGFQHAHILFVIKLETPQ